MSTQQLLHIGMLLGLMGFAVAGDLRRHRIPNLLILLGMALGLVGQAHMDGLAGLAAGAQGLLVGFGLFLPLYALGGMAAGDVKLMSMVGAFLAPQPALLAAAASLIAGGVCGLLLVLFHRQLAMTLSRYWLMLRALTYVAPAANEIAGKPFPYSIAILLGTLASGLWWFGIL